MRTVYFIRWLAGVSGVLALLGTAVTFIAANWQETSKRLFWRDGIALAHLEALPGHSFTAILSNIGDGSVFASSGTIYWRGGNRVFSFQKTIQPKEFSVVNEKNESWDYAGFTASATGIPSDTILESTVLDVREKRGCFVAYFYNVGAIDLTRMNSYYSAIGQTLVTDPARIEVHYYSLHDGKLAVANFDAVATFVRRKKPECAAIN